jgi:hypothetical protein
MSYRKIGPTVTVLINHPTNDSTEKTYRNVAPSTRLDAIIDAIEARYEWTSLVITITNRPRGG